MFRRRAALLQDMAQASTLAALAAALERFLRRAAGRAFAPPDPGAHLLQGALQELLGAVRDFTTRRAAAQVCAGSALHCDLLTSRPAVTYGRSHSLGYMHSGFTG